MVWIKYQQKIIFDQQQVILVSLRAEQPIHQIKKFMSYFKQNMPFLCIGTTCSAPDTGGEGQNPENPGNGGQNPTTENPGNPGNGRLSRPAHAVAATTPW